MQPKAQLDTTKYLWDYLFLVRIPQLQTTSVEYLRAHGTYTTCDKDVDRTLAGQWLTTMLPIHRMVDYYREGVQIKVVNYGDTKIIYDYISAHLAAWRTRLERGINIGDAPVEDLIAMDEFANAVYEHAKYQFTEDTVMSIMAQRLTSVTALTPSTFFKTKPPLSSNEQLDANGNIRINSEDPDAPPDRESLGDFLKERLGGFSSRWH